MLGSFILKNLLTNSFMINKIFNNTDKIYDVMIEIKEKNHIKCCHHTRFVVGNQIANHKII